MPTISEEIHFNFDGLSSREFSVLNVSLDNNMYEETFIAPREIVETKISGREKPAFNKIESSPLEFDMTLAFEKEFDDALMNKIIEWLFKDYYRPLYFEGKENKIYYCLAIGDVKINHNGFGEGYLTFTMRANSPYIYSPVILSEFYDLSQSNSQEIVIMNNGHKIIHPEISITKVGNGDILIKNITYNGEEFEVNDLTDREDIYINTEKGIIETDLSTLGIYRYENIVGDFPQLLKGRNVFQVTGNCLIQFRYQLVYKY